MPLGHSWGTLRRCGTKDGGVGSSSWLAPAHGGFQLSGGGCCWMHSTGGFFMDLRQVLLHWPTGIAGSDFGHLARIQGFCGSCVS